MKKIISIIGTFILFASCDSSKKDTTFMVSDADHKYWDVVNNPNNKSSNGLIGTCYFFNNKGRFKIYNYRNGKRVLYDGGDVIVPEVWNYLSDSTIMIATENYKIEKLTADTFIYSHPEFGRKVLVRSENQSISLDTIIKE